MEHLRVSGEYGFLTREGLRQILVDGGSVSIPEGVKHIGLTLSAFYLATNELLNDSGWCDFQRVKAEIWGEKEEVCK